MATSEDEYDNASLALPAFGSYSSEQSDSLLALASDRFHSAGHAEKVALPRNPTGVLLAALQSQQSVQVGGNHVYRLRLRQRDVGIDVGPSGIETDVARHPLFGDTKPDNNSPVVQIHRERFGAQWKSR